MSYYLAIDQGSHSSRALLFDDRGRVVRRVAITIKLNRLDEVRVEHDADELLASVSGVVDDLLHGLDEKIKQQIVACGITTQRSTVLAWNARGEALGPVLSWQDVRGAAQVESLKKHEAEIQQATGLPLSAHYGASKLHWLLTESAAVKNCAPHELRLSPLVSFILYHLVAGSPYHVDYCNAQRTQLMDISTLDWSSKLTQWFGVPASYLPACKPVYADYGVLKNPASPVTAVCGDQNAAIYGAGELEADVALINLGSGAFILRALHEYRTSDRQLSGIGYSDAGGVRYVREATINGAGSALAWLGKKYNRVDIEQQLPDWLNTIDNPPLFINTVGGLGSPWWRQGLKPRFIDADMGNHAALVVAVIESIVFMLRANLDLMKKESPINRLRVSGGLSASDGLCQKLANLCDLPVERVNNPEVTARGIAWLAAGRPPLWNIDKDAEVFSPAVETGLDQRYANYMEMLNIILEE